MDDISILVERATAVDRDPAAASKATLCAMLARSQLEFDDPDQGRLSQ